MKKNYFLILLLVTSLVSAQSNITFSVDMTGQTFTQAYVSGSFNGWSGDSNPLTDMGGGIWSATIPIADGTYDYKFTYDNWTGQENFAQGQVCTTFNGGFANRFLHVDGADLVLPTPLFSICLEDPDDGPHDITLSVDMSAYANAFTTVYVSGSFNGWCGDCNALTDMGGGIWSGTIAFPEAQHEFKFTHDNWAGQESFAEGEPFTVTNGGFTNRFLQADTSKSLSYVWNSGEVLSVNNLEVANFGVYPNPTANIWNVKTNNTIINSIQVFDMLGKQVLSLNPRSEDVQIDASSLNTGLYFARLESLNGIKTIKLIRN